MIDTSSDVWKISEAIKRAQQELSTLSIEEEKRQRAEQQLIEAKIDCQRALQHATKMSTHPANLH